MFQSKPATESLILRLNRVAAFDDDHVNALRALPISVRSMKGGEVIVHYGDRPSHCVLLIEGFAYRIKSGTRGGQQVLSMHVPGDIPDLQSLHLEVMDHSLICLGNCTLGFIPHSAIRTMYRIHPHLADIFWRDTLIDASRFREWIVNVGQRRADERMASLVLEMSTRLAAIGRATDTMFEWPISQTTLGDALGISAVHTNRVLMQLRTAGLMSMSRSKVTILNRSKLEELAGFDPLYLHQSSSRS